MRNVFVSVELLGTGYEFKCKKCKHSYPIHLGIEMMYPKVSPELLQDIISYKRYGVKVLALRQNRMPDLKQAKELGYGGTVGVLKAMGISEEELKLLSHCFIVWHMH